LEEDDPAAVALLVGFLYRGVIPGTTKIIAPFIKPPSPPSSPHQKTPAILIDTTTGSAFPFVGYRSTPNLQGREIIQHISSDAQYAMYSPEELRVADYQMGRKDHWSTARPARNASQNTVLVSTIVPALSPLQPGSGQLSTGNPLQPQPRWVDPIFSNIRDEPASRPPSQDTAGLFNPTAQRLENVSSSTYGRSTPNLASANGHKPFGMSRSIKYPPSARRFIEGIPRSSDGSSCMGTNDYQLAILKLCILAERLVWPALFNAAIEGYIRGELVAHRPIPVEHVDLIYAGSPSPSNLRIYVLMIMRSNDWDNLAYMPLTKKYEDFMQDVLIALAYPCCERKVTWDNSAIEELWMHERETAPFRRRG
jgi:hypothetical protein